MVKKITAGILVEDDNGEILALHRKSNVPEGGKWGLIGGEINGNDILNSLLIKVKQETGINLENTDIQKVKTYNWSSPNVTFHLFKVTFLKTPKIVLNPEGHHKYKWLDPKNLYYNYPLMEGLYRILEDVYLDK